MAQQGTKTEGPTFDKELAESLVDLEIPQSLRFSPDGKQVVYCGRQNNIQSGKKSRFSRLWLASASEANSARPLTSGLSEDSSPQWHPDGNRILFLSDRSEAGNKYGLWSLRLDGGDAVPITPTDAEQGIDSWQLSPDGRMIAYTSADEQKKSDDGPEPDVWGAKWEYARLRVVDIETRESKVVVGGDRHITDLHWSPDGKKIVFGSECNTTLEESLVTGTTLSTVDVDSGIVSDLCIFKGASRYLKWALDGQIYFNSVIPAGMTRGGGAVSAVDPTEEAPCVKTVAFGQQDDALDIVISGGKVLVKRLERFSTIVSELGGDDLFRFDEAAIQSWDVFYDPGTGSASLAASTSSLNAPEEAFVFINGGKDKIQLSNHGKAFKDRKFGTHQILTCPSSDGEVDIDALFLTPAGHTDFQSKPTQPLPTIVMIHGGPTDSNAIEFDASGMFWSTYALAKGYGVLLPQYRGSLGRGEAFGAYSSKGVGKYDYEDVVTLTDYAIKQGLADADRLLVGGWSQGGYLTYLSSVRNGLHGLGWRFQAGVAGAGITDWDSLCVTSAAGAIVQAELAGGCPPWLAERGEMKGRQGSALWEMAHAVAESKRLGEPVIPPLMILHGANDNVCSTSQAEGFHRGVRAHGLTCEYVKYPGEGHNIMSRKSQLDVLERRMRWAHTYIGAGEAAIGISQTD